MSGERILYPHFGPHEADKMEELADGEHPWIHKASEAHRKEQAAVPDEEITERDQITVREDAHDHASYLHPATR